MKRWYKIEQGFESAKYHFHKFITIKISVNYESASQELTITDQNGAKIIATWLNNCPLDHLTDHMMNIDTIKTSFSLYCRNARNY